MRLKQYIFLCIFWFCPSLFFGQNVEIEISSTPSTCFANGTITITLKGSDVNKLSQIVYTVINTTTQDSRFGIAPYFENLSKGYYSVTMDAYYNSTTPVQRNGNTTVEGDYIAPTAFKIGDAKLLGTRKTLICKNSGRVVLEITGGTFPYVVETYLNSSIYKTDVFNTFQNSGNNANMPDYKDYYNIEELPAGNFTFKIKDGCDYGLPEISESVSRVSTDYYCNNISISPGSNINNYNIVKIDFGEINNESDQFYKYYYDQKNRNIPWWEYTYSYNGGAEKEWKDIPPEWNITDTVNEVQKYCELWNNNFQIKVRVKECSENSCNITRKVEYSGFLDINAHNIFDTITGCVDDNYFKLSVSFSPSSTHEFFTAPINCKVTDNTTGDILADETVNLRYWNWEKKVERSKIGDILRVIIVDKNNCPLFDETKQIPEPPENNWSTFVFHRICNNNNDFDFFNLSWNECIHTVGKPPQNTTIELVESPENHYHFIAKYNRNLNNWIFSDYNDTDFTLSTFDNCNVILRSKDLASGTYKWRIKDDCGRDDSSEGDYEFFDYILDEPFTFETQVTCEGKKYYPKVKLVGKRKNDGFIKNIPVSFEVNGVAGGFYPASGLCNENHVTLTKPGNYRMSFFMNNMSISCLISPKSMSYAYNGLTLKNAFGYACDDGINKVSKVVVTVDSTSGVYPYRFDVYNTAGDFITSNNTGIFYDVGDADSTIVVKITDQCGSSYSQRVKVENLQSGARVAFADNNNVCLGEPIHLHGVSIVGALMGYSWEGPNEFASLKKDPVIDNSTVKDEGHYVLSISGLECAIIDSVYIAIIQPDTGYIDDFVCRGIRYTDNGFDIAPIDIPDSTFIFFKPNLKTQEYNCDSTLCLFLTVRDYAPLSIDSVNEICADAPFFILPCNFHDEEMFFFNIQFNDEALNQGFQNIDTGIIVYEDYLEIPLPDSEHYVMPHNHYGASIYVYNGKCNSRVLEFPFQISYPDWIIEQKWNDVIALLNDRYNGGYTFSKYEWYKNGKKLEGETGSYIYILPTLDFGAEYRALLTRTLDGESFFTCPLIPQYRANVKVYPQIVSLNEPITIETQQDGFAVLWNTLGQTVAQYPLFKNQANKIYLNQSGFFFLEVVSHKEIKEIFKIIIK
ncbi:MAG: hypothetical protein LBU83_14295 [Bacteroidales bacterium]|jgi:hypothetical protein|nr:hypothetical protein [Bacteroidales bacterium]